MIPGVVVVVGGVPVLSCGVMLILAFNLAAQALPLVIMDGAAPGLCFAGATALLGSRLASDGDSGVPTTISWRMDHPHGTGPERRTLAQATGGA